MSRGFNQNCRTTQCLGRLTLKQYNFVWIKNSNNPKWRSKWWKVLTTQQFSWAWSKASIVSVIITVRNDASSVSVRAINSVILTTSPQLVQQIIIVTDNSTNRLNMEIAKYFGGINFIRSVITCLIISFLCYRIIKLREPHGYKKVHNLASSQAEGQVLVFLDSNVECTEGWLEPLLEIVTVNRLVE